MSNHIETVKIERAKYQAPLGFENAWKIVNAVAYTHRAEGWGLLAKTGGTQWNGCSIDVIINLLTQEAVDCLGNSEAEGIPQWSAIEYLPAFGLRWIAPTPGDTAPPVPPNPITPGTPPAVYSDKLVSPDGRFTLSIQNDGNLVLYHAGAPIWASGTGA